MKEDGVLDIMDQCQAADVKFFCKQWGGTDKKNAGRSLNGIEYNDMPSIEQLESINYL